MPKPGPPGAPYASVRSLSRKWKTLLGLCGAWILPDKMFLMEIMGERKLNEGKEINALCYLQMVKKQ